MSTETDFLGMYKPASGEEDWADDMNSNLDIIDAALGVMSEGNILINSDFQKWQHGTSRTHYYEYSADRWVGSGLNTAGSGVVNVTVSQTANGTMKITTSGRDTGRVGVGQPVDYMPTDEIGEVWTIRIKLKRLLSSLPTESKLVLGVNSNAGNIYCWAMTAATTVKTNLNEISDSIYEVYEGQVTIPAGMTTQLTVGVLFTDLDITVDATDLFEIKEITFNKDVIGIPFRPRNSVIEDLLCQHYCRKLGGDSAYGLIAPGKFISSTTGAVLISHPLPMRATPTFTYSGSWGLVAAGTGISEITTMSQNSSGGSSKASSYLYANNENASWTIGNATFLIQYDDGSAYLMFNAEVY